MGRGPLSFKATDVVRAIKAVQSAGLEVVRTEIHTDGRIVLHHQGGVSSPETEETFDEWWERNRGTEKREEAYEEWKARNGEA